MRASKAAVVMAALGPELAAKVYAHLEDDEVEQITVDLAQALPVQPAERLQVLEEFMDLGRMQGGLRMSARYAREVLERALGLQRARDMLARIAEANAPRPFEFLRGMNPQQIVTLIAGEHPQTIALVISFLDPAPAAVVIKSLTPQQQGEVAERVSTMERMNPVLVQSVAQVLERKIESLFGMDLFRAGGVDVVVQLLTRVDRTTERAILGSMEDSDPELADEIRRKMFLFEDLRSVDDRSMQRIIRDADQADIVLALKASSDEMAQVFFRNMSSRMAEVIREDLKFLGPTRLRDVEAAQQRLVALARRLEEAGEIILSSGQGGEAVIG